MQGREGGSRAPKVRDGRAEGGLWYSEDVGRGDGGGVAGAGRWVPQREESTRREVKHVYDTTCGKDAAGLGEKVRGGEAGGW